MLDFITEYGTQILALLVAVGSAAGAVYNIGKVLKLGKKVDATSAQTKADIQITREGIVEAFKLAKIPTEWKISISSQVDKILTEFSDRLTKRVVELEEQNRQIALFSLKILNNTQAVNKLTEDEKNEIIDLLKSISDADSTIDITE